MALPSQLRVMEAVQSLEKGGRTTRFTDTVAGLRDENIYVLPVCLSQPVDWVDINNLAIIERKQGLNWALVFKIRKLIKEHRINIVHAHCELSQLYAGIASFTCNVAVVGTFHRSDLARYTPSLVNKLIKFFVKKYIAVSYDRLSLLTDNLHFPKGDCHVVHGGTHISHAPSPDEIKQARKALKLPTNQITLVSIGHLGSIKGHQDTIAALANIIEKTPNIHLYIAGDGSSFEKQKLQAQVSNLSINEHVTFLGQINNATQWLCACDVFIQPSIEEAFGLVFIEAGAKAKPVIATAVGGIKEIIVSKETGLLVSPASPEELEKALGLLINSKELRTQYGGNGYKRIADFFSLTNMVDSYTEVFNEIVK